PPAINYWKQALAVIPVADGLLASHDCSATIYGVCKTTVSNQTCGEMIIPESHFAPKTRCDICDLSGLCSGCSVISPSNTPIAADMVLYIRATTTSNCSPGVLAYATTCQRDQYDRPTFGMINFCPAYINPSQHVGPIYDKQLTVAKHEITHALGFSAASFPLMREANGTPRTLRVSGGLFGRTKPMPGICNGAMVESISTSFPGNSTIIYRFQRGHYVATMVTPAVSRYVQAYFNCSTLPGADLENNDPACIGSHWEERLFSPESMSPVLNYNGNIFTALTLAYFEDTGWYQPNYSMAEQGSYGLNKGCEFTAEKCIVNNTALDNEVFCTSSNEQCSLNLLSRSYCTRANLSASLPLIYQYYSTPNDGGSNAFPDYCPMVTGYLNGDCAFTVNLLNLPSTTISPLGEMYGSQSKCVMTTLRQTNMRGYSVSGRYSGCYPMSCNKTTMPPTIVISVAQSATIAVPVTCTAKGQVVSVPGFTGTLQCPDPAAVCGRGCTPQCGDQMMCVNGQCIPTKTEPVLQPTPKPAPSLTPTTTPEPTSPTTTLNPTAEPTPSTTINTTQHRLQVRSTQGYTDHPYDPTTRRLEAAVDAASAAIQVVASAYKSMRITPILDSQSLNALSAANYNLVVNKLVPDAVAYWQSTLQVVPINGNWYAERECASTYMTPQPVCQSVYSSQTCFDQVIPTSHYGSTVVCSSCYGSSCTGSGSKCNTIAAGTGVPNTDYVLYVRAVQTKNCGSSVLAYATSCQQDQYDRPIMGMVNFCPNKLDSRISVYTQQLMTAKHELAHALGFTAQMYAYMRDSAGTARTTRDSASGQPTLLTNYVCPNGVTMSSVMIPSDNTLKFFSERGHSVAKLVTPTVLKFAQEYFDCPTLNGVELENQDAGACFGSHWEERIFEPEMMSPLQSFRNVASGLTLAYFQDSGWYKVNFTAQEPMYWGAKRGCPFTSQTCITLSSNGTNTATTSDHYCTDSKMDACTVDLTSRAFCTVSTTAGLNIPSYYRYFSDPTTAGEDFPDYCPILSGYSTGDCRISGNLQYPPGSSTNVKGEIYTTNSYCMKSSLLAQGWISSRTTGCYAASCYNGVITITLAGPSGSITTTCSQKGQALTISPFTGTLYCPDPLVICNTGQCSPACGANMFCSSGTCQCLDGYTKASSSSTSCTPICPDACSGNGVCHTANTTCTCNSGYTNTNCNTTTSSITTKKTNDAVTPSFHKVFAFLLIFLLTT
ncbi:leishmanolysin-like peptidase, metalloprotease family M08, partial [Thraustotheca clavata]